MQIRFLRASVALLLSCGLFAQTPAPQKLEFEVATIKPTPDSSLGHAPPGLPRSPGLKTYRTSLSNLLRTAFELPPGQIAYPDWLYNAQFDVVAEVSPDSSVEQVNVMLQNLLVERFRIALHHELQDKPAYDLIVAKGGPKLKETAYPNAKPVSDGSLEITLDKNDFPILPKELAVQARVDWMKNGSFRSTFRAFPIAELAQHFSNILTEAVPLVGNVIPRVFDKTGLKGRYDFTLEYSNFVYSRPDNDVEVTGPSIFTAVEKQLGLRLEKSKAPLDILVIDHIDKVPTEN